MPEGVVKWFDGGKGFGFLTRDDGGEVFVHASVLPAGVPALVPGQRIEFSVAATGRGERALHVTVLDESRPPGVRRTPTELALMIQDLAAVLDHTERALRRGRHLEQSAADRVGVLLNAAAAELTGNTEPVHRVATGGVSAPQCGW